MALPEGILLSSNAFKIGQEGVERPLNIKAICKVAKPFCSKVGVEGVVDLSPEDVVVLGEGDQAELECKVELKMTNII